MPTPADKWPRSIERLGPGLMGEADVDGSAWRQLEDHELVGLVDRNASPAAAAAEISRRQVRALAQLAELQDREVAATTELTEVQRELLDTIKTYNQQTKSQSNRIEFLTWVMAALTIAQLVSAYLLRK